MKKWKQRGFAFVLALSLTTGMLTGAQAAVSKETLNDAVQDTAEIDVPHRTEPAGRVYRR